MNCDLTRRDIPQTEWLSFIKFAWFVQDSIKDEQKSLLLASKVHDNTPRSYTPKDDKEKEKSKHREKVLETAKRVVRNAAAAARTAYCIKLNYTGPVKEVMEITAQMMEFSARGHLQALKFMYSKGIQFPAETIHAASSGHLECLRYLVSIGVPVDKWCMINAAHGYPKCLEYLMSINAVHDDMPGEYAAQGHLRCLKILHKYDYDLTNINVIRTACKGHLDCVQFLVSIGIMPDLHCKFSTESSSDYPGYPYCLRYIKEIL